MVTTDFIRVVRWLSLLSIFFIVAACAGIQKKTSYTSVIPQHQVNNPWYQQAQQTLNQRMHCEYCSNTESSQQGLPTPAKNVILFVGDGMGISTVTAARILAGQREGKNGEEHQLSFEKMPYTGLVKTYNVDAQVPDSAGTMTAMVAGVKTNFGAIAVDEYSRRADCASQAGRNLLTALELAELSGMSTGIVSTTRLTHATPAANYAKASERNWEYTTDDAACADIASQFVSFEQRLRDYALQISPDRDDTYVIDGVDIMLGGGKRSFISKDRGGKRKDGKNLIQDWLAASDQRVFLETGTQLAGQQLDHKKQVLGLFANSHMAYESDRQSKQLDQPSLTEMTVFALESLSQNPKGYFLQVESGRIDHAHHAGNAYNALSDTVEFSRAIQTVLDRVNLNETLVIVTADHSHVMTIAGYPKRGNDILGYVTAVGETDKTLAEDGLPYTTLGYINGRGSHHFGEETDADIVYHYDISAGRVNVGEDGHPIEEWLDVTLPGYHQEVLVPLKAETHGGEDVAVYAAGPSAYLVSGVIEQHVIFHIMNHAAQFEKRALK